MNQHEINQPVIIHIANEADWMPVMKKIEQIWPEARWINGGQKPTEWPGWHYRALQSDTFFVLIKGNQLYNAGDSPKVKFSHPVQLASDFLALNDKPGEEKSGMVGNDNICPITKRPCEAHKCGADHLSINELLSEFKRQGFNTENWDGEEGAEKAIVDGVIKTVGDYFTTSTPDLTPVEVGEHDIPSNYHNSGLYDSILNELKKLPIKSVGEDSYDRATCAKNIMKLFNHPVKL